MSTYDSDDLKSTLAYIKDRFGLDVFIKTGRVPALLSDLAPSLKNDRIMVERLSRLGILDDFATNMNETVHVQKRMISKAMTQLTQAEFIRPTIAASYIGIMAEVFGWQVNVEVPKEATDEKMKFDSQRYMRESQDRDFCMGKKALDAENFDDARLCLNKAYGQGNILAGVLLGIIYHSGNGCEKNYDKSIPLFVDGMQRGCPLGAEWLAYAYEHGRGVPRDADKAKEIFLACKGSLEAMCASGSVDAQYVYGFDLLYGSFQSTDEKKALYWFKKAMDAGHIGAGVEVAKIYMNGWGVEKSIDKGLQILLKYTNSKNKNAQFELGKAYYYGKSVERDYKKARHHFQKAAECGHAGSQYYVGDIYYYGEGVAVDYVEAKKWYELSAKQENKDANQQLGFIYLFGEGTSVDKVKSFRYFKYAADKGKARAQYMLHYFYLHDEEYINYELGKQYLEKSAEQGDVLAQKLLARCYIGAFGFVVEDEKFVYWMRKAAEQDDPEAQRILGEAYIKLENEEALPKSYPDALKWLEKAANKGDVNANILLGEIHSTVKEYMNERKASYYMERADQLMKVKEQSEILFGEEHEKLADLYYKNGENKITRQKAFDHYGAAYLAGQKSALYDLGWMCFINGYCFELSPDELIQEIINEEKNSESSNLAYLLGLIYFNGYKVRENKAEAEKWYLRAIDKGSSFAASKLALYYVNEKKMYNRGFSILEKAHESGSVEATRLLGLFYKNAIGVKKSRSKAKALLKEAAEKGDEDASTELKKFLF